MARLLKHSRIKLNDHNSSPAKGANGKPMRGTITIYCIKAETLYIRHTRSLLPLDADRRSVQYSFHRLFMVWQPSLARELHAGFVDFKAMMK